MQTQWKATGRSSSISSSLSSDAAAQPTKIADDRSTADSSSDQLVDTSVQALAARRDAVTKSDGHDTDTLDTCASSNTDSLLSVSVPATPSFAADVDSEEMHSEAGDGAAAQESPASVSAPAMSNLHRSDSRRVAFDDDDATGLEARSTWPSTHAVSGQLSDTPRVGDFAGFWAKRDANCINPDMQQSWAPGSEAPLRLRPDESWVVHTIPEAPHEGSPSGSSNRTPDSGIVRSSGSSKTQLPPRKSTSSTPSAIAGTSAPSNTVSSVPAQPRTRCHRDTPRPEALVEIVASNMTADGNELLLTNRASESAHGKAISGMCAGLQMLQPEEPHAHSNASASQPASNIRMNDLAAQLYSQTQGSKVRLNAWVSGQCPRQPRKGDSSATAPHNLAQLRDLIPGVLAQLTQSTTPPVSAESNRLRDSVNANQVAPHLAAVALVAANVAVVAASIASSSNNTSPEASTELDSERHSYP